MCSELSSPCVCIRSHHVEAEPGSMVPGFNVNDMAWQRVVPVAGDDRGTIQQTAPWYLLVAFVLWMKGPQKRHRCDICPMEPRKSVYNFFIGAGSLVRWPFGPWADYFATWGWSLPAEWRYRADPALDGRPRYEIHDHGVPFQQQGRTIVAPVCSLQLAETIRNS